MKNDHLRVSSTCSFIAIFSLCNCSADMANQGKCENQIPDNCPKNQYRFQDHAVDTLYLFELFQSYMTFFPCKLPCSWPHKMHEWRKSGAPWEAAVPTLFFWDIPQEHHGLHLIARKNFALDRDDGLGMDREGFLLAILWGLHGDRHGVVQWSSIPNAGWFGYLSARIRGFLPVCTLSIQIGSSKWDSVCWLPECQRKCRYTISQCALKMMQGQTCSIISLSPKIPLPIP